MDSPSFCWYLIPLVIWHRDYCSELLGTQVCGKIGITSTQLGNPSILFYSPNQYEELSVQTLHLPGEVPATGEIPHLLPRPAEPQAAPGICAAAACTVYIVSSAFREQVERVKETQDQRTLGSLEVPGSFHSVSFPRWPPGASGLLSITMLPSTSFTGTVRFHYQFCWLLFLHWVP